MQIPGTKLLREFGITGKIISAAPFGSGHIHRTFLIETDAHPLQKYIVQKINTHVFPDPEKLMHNALIATTHVNKKRRNKTKDEIIRTPGFLQCRSGDHFFSDSEGNCWRIMLYIPDTGSYDKPQNRNQAGKAGAAFGAFIRILSDLDPRSLHNLLPGFHDIGIRWEQFQSALEKDSLNRATKSIPEINQVLKWKDQMLDYHRSLQDPALPLRVTHNDTKLNNVLFGQNGRDLWVVDLDTVMPGYIHYDFGDAIRTIANNAVEDDPDISGVRFNMDLFNAFSDRFLSQLQDIITREELQLLPFAPLYMTYLIGVRFLTDWLNGDLYYQTQRKLQNLDRTRIQLRLLSEMNASKQRIEQDLYRLLPH